MSDELIELEGSRRPAVEGFITAVRAAAPNLKA